MCGIRQAITVYYFSYNLMDGSEKEFAQTGRLPFTAQNAMVSRMAGNERFVPAARNPNDWPSPEFNAPPLIASSSPIIVNVAFQALVTLRKRLTQTTPSLKFYHESLQNRFRDLILRVAPGVAGNFRRSGFSTIQRFSSLVARRIARVLGK